MCLVDLVVLEKNSHPLHDSNMPRPCLGITMLSSPSSEFCLQLHHFHTQTTFFSFKEKSENCICTFLIWAIPPSPSSEHASAVTHIYFLTRKAYVQARGPDLPLPHPQGLRWVSLTQDPTILKKPSCISCCQSF